MLAYRYSPALTPVPPSGPVLIARSEATTGRGKKKKTTSTEARLHLRQWTVRTSFHLIRVGLYLPPDVEPTLEQKREANAAAIAATVPAHAKP